MFASRMLQEGSLENRRGIALFTNSQFFPTRSGSGARSDSVRRDSESSINSDPEYIMQLVSDVRKFANMLFHLKEAFLTKEHQDCLHQVVHERLGELLQVLKCVIGKHKALNSVDILTATGTLIAKVKGVNFNEVNEDNSPWLFSEIYSSIDTLAFTFGNVVSDFLMGDVENGSPLRLTQTRRSRSSVNLSVDSGGGSLGENDSPGLVPPVQVLEVDDILQQSDGGVESALLYAKAWSKYTKELLNWVDKRLNMDVECAKSLSKMAESARTLANQQEHMPFQDIYISAFKNDIDYSHVLLQTTSVLQANKFMQPLLARKNELDKLRKEVKEQWQREHKKTHDAKSALKKARLLKDQRQEEYKRAQNFTIKVEEEQLGAGGKQLEKRRRLEDEALLRAEEAREHYRHCITEMDVRRIDMANVKSNIISQIRALIFQCDLTLKAVTVNWFQMQQAQAVSLPINNQSLCESAKLYEPGQRYTEFVKSLDLNRTREECFLFEQRRTPNSGSPMTMRSISTSLSSQGNLSQVSIGSGEFLTSDDVDASVPTCSRKLLERHSHSSTDNQALRLQVQFNSWSTAGPGGSMCSDSESVGGSSESRSMDSPPASPGDFKRRLPRTPSTGTMSSADDLDEREPPSDNGLREMVTEMASSPGPFRNAQMSKAAQTHKLRKLRAPSKCRECDSLVVFHGAECEECSLACHKKCLETLAIQCGHKKLQGKLHLFAVDFAQVARNSPDRIPFIIKKCTSEIENRALCVKGIYRVNGAKSRVEKLCQAFENGKDLVELSDLYPHDISNVLKLYLRQLPEPLILFRYYNDFIGLAKESQSVIVEELETSPSGFSSDRCQISVELKRVLFKMKDLLKQLPLAHYRTLQFLMQHLHRVTEKAEENKMTASNLGIIFGPTLIKPRQIDAEMSLSSLVDYPYQALIVELLIRHYNLIFDSPVRPVDERSPFSARFTANEKEQRLSRYSKSMVDIKEQHQSTKSYKRHSSVIPSIHLLDEVKEVKACTDKNDFAPVVSENMNSVLSSVLEVRNSPTLSRRNHVTRVQLRSRSKLNSRPVSMPPERLLNVRNSNAVPDKHGSPYLEEVSEEDKSKSEATVHYRNTYIDTHTLRRTWDKQYKHYGCTSQTEMIMASLPAETETSCIELLSTSAPPSSIAVPEDGEAVGNNCVLNAFRPPRTLKPPPGTFYKPPLNQEKTVQKKTLDDKDDKEIEATKVTNTNCIEDEENNGDEEGGVDEKFGLEVSVDEDPSHDPQTVENKARPFYTRLSARCMHTFENREAHFV